MDINNYNSLELVAVVRFTRRFKPNIITYRECPIFILIFTECPNDFLCRTVHIEIRTNTSEVFHYGSRTVLKWF